jgi:3',5'-cyclic AMP phosphodiesterase CpdA
MRTIVHLSDLHFGALDHGLLEPLLETVQRLDPHVTVVSGDLTQRAKAHQFVEAKRFLAQLPKPQIVVPGNHDVPLYNVYQRFFKPLERYTRYITKNLEPWFADDEIAVAGINTARSFVLKGGRIAEDRIAEVAKKFCALPEGVTKVVVTHHPFDVPGDFKENQIVGRAAEAMAAFTQCGADLFLAGHLHLSHAESTSQRYQVDGGGGLVVQAGTATSTRERGETNSFNFLRVERGSVHIDRYEWDIERGNFVLGRAEAYDHNGKRWKPRKSVKVMTATPRDA